MSHPIAAIAAVTLFICAAQVSAQVSLMDMNNRNGETVARLFLTGKDASFDGQQRLTRGAGYMQATPGHHFNLLAFAKSSKGRYDQVGLHITLIQWDDAGTTTAIDGIEPTADCGSGVSFKIVGKPSLKDGLVTLQLDGGKELTLQPRFWWAATVVGEVDFIFKARGAPSVPVSQPSIRWAAEVRKKRLIAYLSGKDLYVIALDGSNQRMLSDGKQGVHDPRWSPDGKSIAFAVRRENGSALYRVNVDGTGLAQLAECNGSGVFPVWSPDGTRIAYTVRRDGKEEIHVIDRDEKSDHKVTDAADYFSRAWSPDGAWITYDVLSGGNWQIGFMKADGTEQHLLPGGGSSQDPAWSTDSRRILFTSNREGKDAVYLFDVEGSSLKRLTDLTARNFNAAFAQAGHDICFASERDGRMELYTMKDDGSNQRPILERGAPNLNFSFSPDGQFIAFDSEREDEYQICVVGIDGRDLHQLTRNDAGNTDPQWQPR
jgi:Tol biopolymer transport system component